MDEIQAVSNAIQSGGAVFMFVMFIAGFRLKWWIWGEHYHELVLSLQKQLNDMADDRDFWREVGTRSMATTEESVKRLAGHSAIQSVLDQAEREAHAEGRRVTVKDIERIASRQV